MLFIKHNWDKYAKNLTGKQKRGMTVVCERDPLVYKDGQWTGNPRVLVQIAYCSKLDSYGRKRGVEEAQKKTKEVILIKDLARYLSGQAKQNRVDEFTGEYSWRRFALRLL